MAGRVRKNIRELSERVQFGFYVYITENDPIPAMGETTVIPDVEKEIASVYVVRGFFNVPGNWVARALHEHKAHAFEEGCTSLARLEYTSNDDPKNIKRIQEALSKSEFFKLELVKFFQGILGFSVNFMFGPAGNQYASLPPRPEEAPFVVSGGTTGALIETHFGSALVPPQLPSPPSETAAAPPRTSMTEPPTPSSPITTTTTSTDEKTSAPSIFSTTPTPSTVVEEKPPKISNVDIMIGGTAYVGLWSALGMYVGVVAFQLAFPWLLLPMAVAAIVGVPFYFGLRAIGLSDRDVLRGSVAVSVGVTLALTIGILGFSLNPFSLIALAAIGAGVVFGVLVYAGIKKWISAREEKQVGKDLPSYLPPQEATTNLSSTTSSAPTHHLAASREETPSTAPGARNVWDKKQF